MLDEEEENYRTIVLNEKKLYKEQLIFRTCQRQKIAEIDKGLLIFVGIETDDFRRYGSE